ncbi:hypothetical protein ACWD00_33025 [Streptomyces viridiviolaceus]
MVSAGADNPLTRLLPTYGSVQAATAAGFSTTPVPAYLALQLLWFAATALWASWPSTTAPVTPCPGQAVTTAP